MNVEARLAKANNENSDDDEAEDDGEGDVAEVELAATTGDLAIDFKKGEGGDGENEGELRNADAGIGDGIDNEPSMGEPGDFREDEAADDRDKGVFLVGGLDEDVVSGGETDDKLGDDEDPGIGEGGEDAGGGGAEKDGDEGLDYGEVERRAGLNHDEPEGVAGHEGEVDGEEGGAGGVGEEDKADTDNEVDEARADIEPPVAMVDGKNAPFRGEDKNKTDDAVAGDDSGADRDDREEEVEDNMHERTQGVAAFANKNIICHEIIITKKWLVEWMIVNLVENNKC